MIKVRYDKRVKEEHKLRRASIGSAGYDVCSLESLTIHPGGRALIRTGVYVELPFDTCGDLVHRSGMNAKQGAIVYGTIDCDYRGELMVSMYNSDPNRNIMIEKGDRIAQLVVKELYGGSLEEVSELSHTERGGHGHGSTGK